MTTHTPPVRPARRPRARHVTSTEAKNRFGQVFDAALQGTVVVITKHAVPKAVILSYDAYQALTRPSSEKLKQLGASFDAMLARMQTPRIRAGTRAGFSATPKQLGKAAVAAAKRRG